MIPLYRYTPGPLQQKIGEILPIKIGRFILKVYGSQDVALEKLI